MRKSVLASVAIVAGLCTVFSSAGCGDDDNEVRDRPRDDYYDQNQNYPDNRYDNDRTLHYGEYGGVTVDVRRQGDRNDDWDDDRDEWRDQEKDRRKEEEKREKEWREREKDRRKEEAKREKEWRERQEDRYDDDDDDWDDD